MADAEKPIIIIKKKGGHGGHHGGAWKVAYADFVTAMMAFFMVMWLLNTAQHQTRQAIAFYFRKPGWLQQSSGNPFGADGVGLLPEAFGPTSPDKVKPQERWELRKKKITTPERAKNSENGKKQDRKGFSRVPMDNNDPNGSNISKTPIETSFSSPMEQTGELNPETAGLKDNHPGEGEVGEFDPDNGQQVNRNLSEAQAVYQNIINELANNPELKEILGQIEVRLDPEGITLEVMDTEKASMFAPASTKILPRAELAFSGIVNLLRPLPHPIELIGHTDATPFASFPSSMSNWDLSALRANEARKVLQYRGFPESRVLAVIGKADTDLRFPETPFAAGNRRITVRLKFNDGRTNAPVVNEQLLRIKPRSTMTPIASPIRQATKRPTPQATQIPTPRPTPKIIPSPPPTPRQQLRPSPTSPPRKPIKLGGRPIPPELQPFPVLKPGQLAKENTGFNR
jgi:chemotaxis protein MotB